MTGHPTDDIRGTQGRELSGKRIVLGITGSIAAYQAPDIARTLIRHGASVFPVMTFSAAEIIHPNVMEWATGNAAVVKLTGRIEHVDFTTGANRCDLMIIAPCTGNTIGKVACGIDDTTVTSYATSAIGARIPLLIAPAMHESMYDQPLILQNIEKLQNVGVHFVGPRVEEGKAKLAAATEIMSEAITILSAKDMADLRVLITAGPTVEHIDPVRVITNRSSGKMGAALARVAQARGAKVTVICGPGSAPLPTGIHRVDVETTRQMFDATISSLKSDHYALVFATAAAADYAPKTPFKNKIQTRTARSLTLELESTPKMLDEVKKVSSRSILVAFKAEAWVSREEMVKRAHERLVEANVDLIVANDVGRSDIGFGSEFNEAMVVDRAGNITELPRAGKTEIARAVIELALRLRGPA